MAAAASEHPFPFLPAGFVFPNLNITIERCAGEMRERTTEADGHREPTQHGVLPCLAGGEGRRGDACTFMGAPYLPWQELLCWQLSATPAAGAVCILLNVHNTPTSLKLRKDGRGQLSMYSMKTPIREQLLHNSPSPVIPVMRINPACVARLAVYFSSWQPCLQLPSPPLPQPQPAPVSTIPSILSV